MYSKIKITGIINIETGMHIGASDGFSVIGAVDSKGCSLKNSLYTGEFSKGKNQKPGSKSIFR